MSNVNYSMKIEEVHINFLTCVNDTLLKRGNQISWSSIKEDKKHIGDNTITYLAEVNNGYKKEVTFRLVQVTTKLTNDGDIRRQYTEVVMEDTDNEFGKIICNTNDVKKATKTLKNKMSTEYRKTLEKRTKDTKELKEQNKKLNKDLDDEKYQRKQDFQNFTRKYADLNEKYVESERKNEVLVVDNSKLNNRVMVLEKKVEKMSKASLEGLSIGDWKRLIKIICKGVVTGKTTEQIKEKVFEFLDECSKDEE